MEASNYQFKELEKNYSKYKNVKLLNLLVKQDEVAKFVAKKLGIPEELIRSSEEMQQAAQQMQQMMGQQQGGMEQEQPEEIQ